MKHTKLAAFVILAGGVMGALPALAQAQSTSISDPAIMYTRLLLEKGDYSVQRIGSYKVQGTQYLYGERIPGEVYAPEGNATGLLISYDTYRQQIELMTSATDKNVLTKDYRNVDSFVMTPKDKPSLRFINATALGVKTKGFFQRVESGARYSLYKRYFSDLGVVSTNYVDANLRQFDLNREYYYYDAVQKTLKKIRLTDHDVAKEFSQVRDISERLAGNTLNADPEGVLKGIITALNGVK